MKLAKAMVLAAFCFFTTGAVLAKLPPLSDEQKAHAEQAKAKAAATAKEAAELLTKAQDRVANRYIQQQKAKGVAVKPTPIAASANDVADAATVAPAAPELSAASLNY